MKKRSAFLLAVITLVIGYSINKPAVSDNVTPKIAILDSKAIIAKSTKVSNIEKDRKTKLENLKQYVETARADVKKQKTDADKEKMSKKYQAEVDKRQAAMNKEYTTKINAAYKDISNTIAQEAVKQGYTIVLSKGIVLYGGDDITASVQKVVK